ncbi:WD domain, G-beta repeat [Rosistilla carotiformis]|uniref:WD domain, G-beta repeat n=1 Tax=Rosistilla carotiformis TaxID=2528017 RepID=A0A518JVC0_9BACT|nr:c-type cytochrome domain-containing protein [Rosistilla carotiformis]QDV69490.1 WD domain, G-beta repeat [Rosistilla carotiformis]
MRPVVSAVILGWLMSGVAARADDAIDFNAEVVPILNSYCVGCHNESDASGEVRLDDWDHFPAVVGDAPFLVGEDPDASQLLALMRGTTEPRMPPASEPQPSEAEIEIIELWIAEGAKPPGAKPAGTEPMASMFPKVDAVAGSDQRIDSLDFAAGKNLLALAKFGRVDLVDANTEQVIRQIEGLPGKVNAVRFSHDEKYLLVAGGVTGVAGQVGLWDLAQSQFVNRWQTPSDSIYAVDITHDNQTIAAGGYDRIVRIWNRDSDKPTKTLDGHNGPIHGVRFDPSGQVLATASGDETIKLWNVASGERLDTLGQPLAEQYCVRFSKDGKQVIGAGADNRIRVWELASPTEAKVSPLTIARFAHERPIVALAINPAGDLLGTAAEDGSVKIWDRADCRLLHQFPTLQLPASGLEFIDQGKVLLASTPDGRLHRFTLPDDLSQDDAAVKDPVPPAGVDAQPVTSPPTPLTEVEPNDSPKRAQAISWPSKTSGVIRLTEDGAGESDLFRIQALAGQMVQIEISAADQKSPLDSRVDVLDVIGDPVPRMQLQAVRDSYFTFRGKNSTQTGDFRVHNWQEMELNEYLYSNGEVVRLWLYPRGPDSGFEVYPGFGDRRTYFGTTAISHALGEPAYIVRPLPPHAKPLPNGLPVFTVNYENDDDPQRRHGTDSRLDFTAPTDGEYLIRVRDSRGFGGDDFRYDLTIRHPDPRFEVSIISKDLKIRPGAGGEFVVRATRHDGFDGPIQIGIENLPEGFVASTPLSIQAGQSEAVGTITALPTVHAPSADQEPVQLFATATILNKQIRVPVGELGKLEIATDDALIVHLMPVDFNAPVAWFADSPDDADSGQGRQDDETRDDKTIRRNAQQPFEIVIRPGETRTARVVAERGDFKGVIRFGNVDSGRNLPHGVYVDNLGLNGLMIPVGQTEREFFITAAPWLTETDRLFHLRATVKGNPTTWPILLKVRD